MVGSRKSNVDGLVRLTGWRGGGEEVENMTVTLAPEITECQGDCTSRGVL